MAVENPWLNVWRLATGDWRLAKSTTTLSQSMVLLKIVNDCIDRVAARFEDEDQKAAQDRIRVEENLYAENGDVARPDLRQASLAIPSPQQGKRAPRPQSDTLTIRDSYFVRHQTTSRLALSIQRLIGEAK